MVSSIISYVLLVAMATKCLSQEPEVREWQVGAMPNPMERPQACGRNGPSLVCDPENLLPLNLANRIDDQLQKIYNTTHVPCYTANPKASKIKGYLVMLAVVPKMQKFFTQNEKEDNIYTRYREGRSFAYHLGRDVLWGKLANCNEMVVILYSKGDQILYTSTQSRAREILTDDIVRSVTLNTLIKFYPFTTTDRKAAQAINYMVEQYSKTLENGGKV